MTRDPDISPALRTRLIALGWTPPVEATGEAYDEMFVKAVRNMPLSPEAAELAGDMRTGK